MAKISLTNLIFFLFFSHCIEGHPQGLFIDHRIILVLHKLHQYEQHSSEEKKTRIQLELKTESEKKTASMPISQLVQIISGLIFSLIDYIVDY